MTPAAARRERTRLERRIEALIETAGPIDIATFMTLALAHPSEGYYASRAAIGAEGDFITAPEVSQLFGELIGLALAAAWQGAGAPPAYLVELGPGNGTLLSDLWRATAGVPGFHAAVEPRLIETSQHLRARQAARLADIGGIAWHADIAHVPQDRPLLVVANEFFDALPVRQYIREAAGWREIKVDRDQDGRLCLVVSAEPSPIGRGIAQTQVAGDAPIGSVVEIAPAREAVMDQLGGRLAAQGGLALVIDYGETAPTPGSTLQAVSGHRKVPVLTRPGEVDLTSRVAFGPLMAVARAAGLGVFGPVPQGVFLQRLGAQVRLRQLCAAASPAVAARLQAGHARLTDAAAMGALFKVLAVTGWPGPPPGFLAEEAAA